MKNLANCKPSEFLKQTNRIKKAVEKWLTDTDILNIRKNMPEIEEIKPNASAEEAKNIVALNKERAKVQAKSNLSKMFDAIFEEHPDETLELIALLCFVEPEHVDDYPISDYLEAIADMISNESVIGFFTSLVRLGQINILNT